MQLDVIIVAHGVEGLLSKIPTIYVNALRRHPVLVAAEEPHIVAIAIESVLHPRGKIMSHVYYHTNVGRGKPARAGPHQ